MKAKGKRQEAKGKSEDGKKSGLHQSSLMKAALFGTKVDDRKPSCHPPFAF